MLIEKTTLCYTVSDLYNLRIIPIGKNKLYELVRSKGFPSIRIGRRIIIPRKAFEHWMNSISFNVGDVNT